MGKQYCIVKDGKCFEGSIEEIVEHCCIIHFIDNRIYVKFKGQDIVELPSYPIFFNSEEVNREINRIILRMLSKFGFNVYEEY
jgi:hypothetical protein